MTRNSLIDLLLAYGPRPDGNAMYDEFVTAEAETAGHEPLRIQEGESERIVRDLNADDPVSVILTGTAGDGKTFTARQAFERLRPGQWDGTKTENVATLPSGRRVIFLKDLSELSRGERERWFPRFAAALDGEGDELFVACVNDGQLLSFFRERRDDPKADALLEEVTRMLQQEIDRPSGERPFRLVHMSRRSHAETLDAIFQEILDHDGWNACPSDCSALAGANPCPIRRNRDIMRAEDGIFRQRVRNAIEIAAADDRHLALRQLIILVVNALLGEDHDGQTRLMTCQRAQDVARNGAYARTNPYANVLGFNHPEETRRSVGAFETLARLGIGEETTNGFDEALLDEEGFASLPQDETYGEPIFKRIRDEYAERPSENAAAIRAALKTQRRRLFFTMAPRCDGASGDPWHLTRFHAGQGYLNLTRTLASGEAPPPEVVRRITLGLNRTMTGCLTRSDDAIWLTRPGGEAHGRTVPLLVDQPIPWSGRHTKAIIAAPAASGRPPKLEVWDRGDCYGRLDLSPTMFEFLLRVSEGALPGSFGSQCLQEIRTFQITTAGALEAAANEARETLPLRAIRLRDSDGALEAHAIRLLETTT